MKFKDYRTKKNWTVYHGNDEVCHLHNVTCRDARSTMHTYITEILKITDEHRKEEFYLTEDEDLF